MSSLQVYWVGFTWVIVMWISFVIITLTIKQPRRPAERKRDPLSMFGIVLQFCGYLLVWSIRRRYGEPILRMSLPVEIGLTAAMLVLGVCSVWMVAAAMQTLGKQWSFQARIVEGHRLVTRGPYRIVRNPIYSGMLGMLIVTGLAISHWIGLLAALVFCVVGTFIRVRAEEKLLRETFGAEFEDYLRRVPALIPWIR